MSKHILFNLFPVDKIIIAIDGHSSCGKSTLANDLSEHFGYLYISSGAMYRAVTLYFLENQIDIKDSAAVNTALKKIDIHFEIHEGVTLTYLNGKNVEDEIRGMAVSNFVSPVSTISAVRRAMVLQQQQLGKSKGIVMDGRDIGTVVFRDAELKIFLTADIQTRAQRRYNEMEAKGLNVSFEEVQSNLTHRDYIDSTREDSPLMKAKDAVVIDNSNLSIAEQLAMIISLVNLRIGHSIKTIVN